MIDKIFDIILFVAASGAPAASRPRHNSCHSDAPGSISSSRTSVWTGEQSPSSTNGQPLPPPSQLPCKATNSPAGPHAPTIVSAHAKIPDNNNRPSSPRSREFSLLTLFIIPKAMRTHDLLLRYGGGRYIFILFRNKS